MTMHADQLAPEISLAQVDWAGLRQGNAQVQHTLEETALYLVERGIMDKPLDKGGMSRFEERLFRKLRNNPVIRELYRETFKKEPPVVKEKKTAPVARIATVQGEFPEDSASTIIADETIDKKEVAQ